MATGERDPGPVPAGRDPDRYDRLRRRVLWSMPTGLFVVGSRSADRVNLMTANWVMQVAITPKLVAVSVEHDSVTRRLIEAGGSFSVSILSRQDKAVVRRFVKPVLEVSRDAAGVVVAMQGQPVVEVARGLPCLADSLAWLACDLRNVGDWSEPTDSSAAEPPSPVSHVLFIGEVVDAGERATQPGAGEDGAPEDRGVLRMEDTKMNYGG